LRDYHHRVQMVFQDPYGALNPLHTVDYTLTRPCQNFLGMSARQAKERVDELPETGDEPDEAAIDQDELLRRLEEFKREMFTNE